MTLRLASLAIIVALLPSAAFCATVDFSNLGTITTPQLVVGDVTVTGSADIHLLNFNGLGVVGGISDSVVDGTEWVEFTFTGGPATNVSFVVPVASNLGASPLGGERVVEAFDSLGSSLGSFNENNSGGFSVSVLVGNSPISRFRLTANVDAFRIGSLTYDVTAVPEPSSLGLAAAGVLGLAALRRRHSRS